MLGVAVCRSGRGTDGGALATASTVLTEMVRVKAVTQLTSVSDRKPLRLSFELTQHGGEKSKERTPILDPGPHRP